MKLRTFFSLNLFFCLLAGTICIACSTNSSGEANVAIAVQQNDEDEIGTDPKNFFKDCRKLLANAQKNDSILFTQTEISKPMANKALKAFTNYAYYCGNDSLGPVFLIKAAQVATAVDNAPQAKMVLEKCIEDYPEFSNISAAIFLLAQLYDEQTYLNNEEEARRLYEEIIAKYPKSPEALSAKGALRFIGKTDKEIMEQLKKDEKLPKQSVIITQ
jgi:predicted Zn-dependent protease